MDADAQSRAQLCDTPTRSRRIDWLTTTNGLAMLGSLGGGGMRMLDTPKGVERTALDLPLFGDEDDGGAGEMAASPPRTPRWRTRPVIIAAVVVVALALVLTPLAIARSRKT